MENFCNQTKESAEARALSIESGSIAYHTNLTLNKGESYSGIQHITFTIVNTDNVFLECICKSIESYKINNTNVELLEGENYLTKFVNEEFVMEIPKSMLKIGENTIEIAFSNEYFNDGCGIHSYTDIDGAQYVYTQCEPHWFNRVAPVFDQPDLKGTFQLTAKAPSDWKVISHQPITSCKDVESDMKLWKFPPTFPLSTYLYTIIVGPFKEIVCPEDKLYSNIPMSIFCRETLYEFALKQQIDIFEFTGNTIGRYEDLFGFNFPFKKSDTIFCPEYCTGAMENPGCITYHEDYLYRHEPTDSEITERASTINHELAHMWFGDLVTMKWWNNLWLNESFADFVCYVILDDQFGQMSFPIVNGWILFNQNKGPGYREDQLVTTHPIAAEVKDVHEAESIFDGITYCKGAAVMRQLYAQMGRANFSEAMGAYFKKYAYNNATLQDLLDTMQSVLDEQTDLEYKFDLTQFRKDWIETAGLNEVTCQWNQEDKSANAKVTLVQGYCLEQYPLLRLHKMNVGFYDGDGNLLKSKPILLQNQKETVVEYDGTKNVKAIIPNIDDLTFIKIVLDENTLTWVRKNISNVKDDLTRCLVWRCLFEMVRDSRLKSGDFVDLMCEHIPKENSEPILKLMMNYFSGALFQYMPETMLDAKMDKAWKAIYEKLLKTKDAELTKLLQDLLVTFSDSKEALTTLSAWYDGNLEKLNHLKLTLDQKWRIVFKIQSCDVFIQEYKDKCVKDMEDSDTTDQKKEYKEKITALVASDSQREELWKEYMNKDTKMSYHEIGNSAEGFNSRLVAYEKREVYHQRFFDGLIDMLLTRNREAAKSLYNGLMPMYKDYGDMIISFEKLEKLQEYEKLDAFWKKELKADFDQFKKKNKILQFALA